jgi:hypothetical protein
VKKKLTVNQSIESLTRKGAEIDSHNKKIDISGAKNLGNKSWGMIDFLVLHQDHSLLGFNTYMELKKDD